MLAAAVASSRLAGALEHVISVDRVRIYKPAPAVYALGPETLGVPATDLLFVSSNAWDVAGPKAFGYSVAWFHRLGAPGEGLGLPADHVVARLSDRPCTRPPNAGAFARPYRRPPKKEAAR